MGIFPYGEKEIAYLHNKDKKLAGAIRQIGRIEREVNPDVFSSLISSIVSQQISGKAAETVYSRLCQLLGKVTPQSIENLEINNIQQCGMSLKKASYIKNAAQFVVSGRLCLDELPGLPDQEVIDRLTELPGIGVWTAEMLLIFSLGRPDVLSWNDFGIRKGICTLYGHKELTKKRFSTYKKRYSPYGSIASLYLWEIASGRLI